MSPWYAILVPLLMGLGGFIAWIIKSKVEELRAIEERLREQRRTVYAKLIEPYVQLFADPKGAGKAKALQSIVSYDYRRNAFDLNLLGSDEVIRAYNALMMHVYEADRTGQRDPKELMPLFGTLLLELRKSLGNKRTQLAPIDMLRGMIKDIDQALGLGAVRGHEPEEAANHQV